MKIDNDLKLDFSDVLIRPKRSTLTSRSEVDLTRTFTFKHTGHTWTGIPIIAANMDTIGTFPMYKALSQHQVLTALHKHHHIDDVVDHFMVGIDPSQATGYGYWLREPEKYSEFEYGLGPFTKTQASTLSFYSMGISDADYSKFNKVMNLVAVESKIEYIDDRSNCGMYHNNHPIKMVCIDVANGYTETFVAFIKKIRREYPHLVIMAGNVVTAEMTEQLILAGADVIKCGLGNGSGCLTRKMAGVGYPQLSAIMECADAAHGLGGLICSDGGCTVPGDVAKAIGAGADFVMLGGMLAAHTESGGESSVDSDGNQVKEFYGMSSDTAMNKYSNGMATYKASEGKTVSIPYRGPVSDTIMEILGGIRSTCSYVGANSLKELSKRTTFIRVNNQLNNIFGK